MRAVLTYDEEAKAAYLDLTPNRAKFQGIAAKQVAYTVENDSVQINDQIMTIVIVDYDYNGSPLGMEFLP